MARSKLTDAQVDLIFSLKEQSGFTQKQIAEQVGCTQPAVSYVLRGSRTPHKKPGVHKRTADRYEYFRGDEVRNTGNLCNGEPIYEHVDTVFEQVAFEEEMELIHG